MRSAFKLFGAKDTSSFNKRFERSLWKLTFLYVVTLFVILFLSSGVLYSAFNTRVSHRYEEFSPLTDTDDQVFSRQTSPTQKELQEDLVESLILVNGILLLLGAIMSYWLAQKTLYPLKESYENQKRFIADVSHELRTPLSILKIDLENKLHSQNLLPNDINGAKSHLEEVNRMSGLVEDLLVLSRLNEEGRVAPKNINLIELNSVLKNSINHLTPLATEHHVSIKLEYETNNINIETDEHLLNKVINNLLKNAILYNKPNGEVLISSQTESKYVIIKIQDTGIGIPVSDLNKIFERFYRVDKSRSRQTGGSGLGLSIVESSIKTLGGEIQIESKNNVGTTITVKLPVK